jgi:muconolactone delta-isomerase
MLFSVISHPRSERPTAVAEARLSFWPWIGRYQADRVCLTIYPRVGRGAVAIFDVTDNEQLHRIMSEWADIIPAEFDVYPLLDVKAANSLLSAQAKKE